MTFCAIFFFLKLKRLTKKILSSDNHWEIKAMVSAAYFAHKSILQLVVSDLWHWYSSQNRKSMQKSRLLDDIVLLLRYISQNPNFSQVLQEPPAAHVSRMLDVYSEFISLTGTSLIDSNFLASGPHFSIKTAHNYCAIVQRLSEALNSSTHMAAKGDFTMKSLTWPIDLRRVVLERLLDWYNIVFDLNASMVAQGTVATKNKLHILRQELLPKIGQAAEKLFLLGDLFNGKPVPVPILAWMARLVSCYLEIFL